VVLLAVLHRWRFPSDLARFGGLFLAVLFPMCFPVPYLGSWRELMILWELTFSPLHPLMAYQRVCAGKFQRDQAHDGVQASHVVN
jgi:hypothetical protein